MVRAALGPGDAAGRVVATAGRFGVCVPPMAGRLRRPRPVEPRGEADSRGAKNRRCVWPAQWRRHLPRRADTAHDGFARTAAALPPRHRRWFDAVVPALLGADRRLRHGVARHPRGSRRRRVDRQRPEGLELRRPLRPLRHPDRPDRSRCAQAPRGHLLPDRHAATGGRRTAAARDDRRRRFQRGVLRRRPCARLGSRRRRGRWLAHRDDDPLVRTRSRQRRPRRHRRVLRSRSHGAGGRARRAGERSGRWLLDRDERAGRRGVRRCHRRRLGHRRSGDA